ncbi:MAG: class I SAM-dependent methyltransferase [Lewinellaceae bacterium]|nr:class I SAM-dependent methyltransferase [Lewinellaceae bacterium]
MNTDAVQLKMLLQQYFVGMDVLEIACGTGFWTQSIAQTAKSILATDINEAVIDIARAKHYEAPVRFQVADVFHLDALPENFDAVFGGFIWSHIPLQQLDDFIAALSAKIRPAGMLVFADNQYVEGSNTPVHSRDVQGNYYQKRTLLDGSQHLVVKNFPGDDFFREKLANSAVEIVRLKYFWAVKGKVI